ncbi:MAG: S9 family peptidase [Planctomycetes bacterium]|nr:S9 family peptidase [Planctomycetota bacterium]
MQYPKAGTTNSSCRVGVVPALGGETVWMQTPGDPRQTYLPRMEWHPAGKELMVQWLPRQQNVIRVYGCDVENGRARVVHEESDSAYIDVREDFRWADGGRSYFWTSDRGGWRQAFLQPWSKGEAVTMTPAGRDVMSVLFVEVDSGRMWLSGSSGNATQQYLYGSTSATSGIQRLTPADQPGWHDYQISSDGSLAIHTYSRFDEPPVIDLVRLPAHERVRVLVDNAELRARYSALARGTNEFFQVRIPADGNTTPREPGSAQPQPAAVTLDGWVMYPPDFDARRRWPVVFHVYGEPWSQTVKDTWFLGHHLFHRWLTQLGYVVMSVDARGTPAPKGRDWRKALYQKIGVTSSQDWNAAVQALCAQQGWIDRSRLSIWGWSGGGAMTLNLLFRCPDLFAAGMAVAPVTDIALYDTIYQERYCGIPQEVPDVYVRCSPITFAKDLRAPLLLVHGTGDDNVHFQHSERLFDELVARGKRFEYLAYPNRTHAIAEGRNTRAHLYDSLQDFVVRRVAPGPR